MRRLSTALRVVCILALYIGADFPADAEAPQLACDVPLVPLEAPGFVQLTSCVLRAELRCDEAHCALCVEQTYQLHNRDRIKGSTLRVGLPKPDAEAAPMPEVVLKDGEGTPISLLGLTVLHSRVWEISLDPDERRVLAFSYARPVSPGHFLRWQWDMARLSPWGTVEGARVELKLPYHVTDDAFLEVRPVPFGFDGTTLSWEHERLEAPLSHNVLMISPLTWKRLRELRATAAHHELARFYVDIQKAAQRERVPLADQYEEIVAELQAAIEEAPDNVAARLDLANLYQARADASPQMRLNYLLLAAEELATVLRQQPGDRQVASVLGRTYYDAARVASEANDPAGALAYLRKARQTPGADLGPDPNEYEDLTLHWALDLAERGHVGQALADLEGVLSPEKHGALLRYAPPLASAHTEVDLNPEMRSAHCSFCLYPASASETMARLQGITDRLKTLEGCLVALTPDSSNRDRVTLDISVTYSALSELRKRSLAVLEVLSEDDDLISAIAAAPWEMDLRVYAAESTPWTDRYVYDEGVDLSPLHDVWEMQSQYIRWRLVELQDAPPGDERAQLEQRFALIALREQRQIWEHLPSGTYWVYRVAFGDTSGAPRRAWLLGWGQTRSLEMVHPVYRWDDVLRVSLIGLGLVLLFSTVSLLARRR